MSASRKELEVAVANRRPVREPVLAAIKMEA
jgi:hypothetical protein